MRKYQKGEKILRKYDYDRESLNKKVRVWWYYKAGWESKRTKEWEEMGKM